MNLHVALYEPEIAPNVGAVARLCVATGTTLHLVGRLGFQLNDRRIRRAGLDYWEHVRIERHVDLAAMREATQAPTVYFSTRARHCVYDVELPADCVLVFGPESRGLPASVLADEADRCVRIPILAAEVRSLNLATAVAIGLYEAVRRNLPGTL